MRDDVSGKAVVNGRSSRNARVRMPGDGDECQGRQDTRQWLLHKAPHNDMDRALLNDRHGPTILSTYYTNTCAHDSCLAGLRTSNVREQCSDTWRQTQDVTNNLGPEGMGCKRAREEKTQSPCHE